MDELTKVQFALRRQLAGRTVMSNEVMYKHLINAADECETARIEMAKRMVRQAPQPLGGCRLMKLPEEIEDTFLELASFDERAKAKRSKLRALEIQITLDVTTAKDPTTGKLLLSNEKQRDAAIASTLAESQEYSEIATELGNLEQDRLRLQARLERLRMEFRVEMLEAEQRNALAVLKVADSIWAARHNSQFATATQEEVTLPF